MAAPLLVAESARENWWGGATRACPGQGSHIVDFNEVMAGGQSPSGYSGEKKAFETEMQTLMDLPKGSTYKREGSTMEFERPDSEDHRKGNDFFIDFILRTQYGYTQDAPGGDMYEKP